MHHFAGGLVGECEQQDAVGGNALFEQVGRHGRERARFAGTGAGDDEGRAGRRGDGGQYCLRVQFARVINLQIDSERNGFNNVMRDMGRN